MDAGTGRFTYVSPQAEPLLGYPTRRWLEDSGFWTDAARLAPERRASWAVPSAPRATVAASDHEFEYQVVAADGGSAGCGTWCG